MSDQFVAEIRIFPFNFAPTGWAFCDGQLLSIAENDVLFVLIGTTYGGDGESTFALPDMRGRVPVHQGTLSVYGGNYNVGDMAGVENALVLPANLPTSFSSVSMTVQIPKSRAISVLRLAVALDPTLRRSAVN